MEITFFKIFSINFESCFGNESILLKTISYSFSASANMPSNWFLYKSSTSSLNCIFLIIFDKAFNSFPISSIFMSIFFVRIDTSPLSQAKIISFFICILCNACSIAPIPLKTVANLIIILSLAFLL